VEGQRRIGCAHATRMALLACVAALIAAGCGSSSNSNSSASGGGAGSTTSAASAAGGQTTSSSGASSAAKHVNLTFLDAAATTYGIAMEVQARQDAAADNASIKVQDANFDPQRQNAQCQDAVASHQVQGLLIYAVDNAAIVPCVRSAAAAGIKVASLEGQIGPKLCTDKGHQVPGITLEVYYCADGFGTFWTDMLVKGCGTKPCNVAVFTGPPSYALVAREFAALQTALKAHPNIKILAHYTPGYDAAQQAAASTRTLMLKYPQTNVILEDDDSSAAGVVQTLKQLGKTNSVKVIGTGANKAAVQRIKDGTEFGSILDTPRTDTTEAINDILKVIRGGTLTETEISSPTISPLGKGNWLLTKDNVTSYTAQW
jgi:ribose transport system substrate-binding protein